MSCDNNWTVEFTGVLGRNGPFEIRPTEMNLQINRNEYDVCRARFDQSVGEAMKPHTRDSGLLSRKELVTFDVDGHPMHTMAFFPDEVRYGKHDTHIRFLDAMRALDSGTVDKQWETVTLKDAYQHVWEEADTRVHRGIKFTDEVGNLTATSFDRLDYALDVSTPVLDIRKAKEQNNIVVEGRYAVDFDNVSPAQAIWQLNDTYKVRSWTGPEGYLWIGVPEHDPTYHIAAPDDNRVWRYSDDPQIRHPRDPIYRVEVEGKWISVPQADQYTDWVKDNLMNPLDPTSNEESPISRRRAIGVAWREDLSGGQTIRLEDTEAKTDALGANAEQIMREKMIEQNTGTVEIHPDLSGTEVSDFYDIQTGDFIHVVPQERNIEVPHPRAGAVGYEASVVDEDERCGGIVNNEIYLITGISHNVTAGGYWTITLDVALYPDQSRRPTNSEVYWWDPDTEELHDSRK